MKSCHDRQTEENEIKMDQRKKKIHVIGWKWSSEIDEESALAKAMMLELLSGAEKE